MTTTAAHTATAATAPGAARSAMAVLTLLDERPMHGYELITVLEERSGGRWKPSPGAIYPALGKLEGTWSDHVHRTRRQAPVRADRGRAHRSRPRSASAAEGAPGTSSSMGGHGDLRRATRRAGRPGPPDRPLRHDRPDRGREQGRQGRHHQALQDPRRRPVEARSRADEP